MNLILNPRAKTVPSNYNVKGVDVDLGLPPGYSLTDEAMEKAQRQENEYYDWQGYERVANPVVEHPEYRAKGEAFALRTYWEDKLKGKVEESTEEAE